MENEHKLKMKSLLKKNCRAKGKITLRNLFGNFSETDSEKCDRNFIKNFPFNEIEEQNIKDNSPPLLMISGFVAYKKDYTSYRMRDVLLSTR